jgi:hypothetical protein
MFRCWAGACMQPGHTGAAELCHHSAPCQWQVRTIDQQRILGEFVPMVVNGCQGRSWNVIRELKRKNVVACSTAHIWTGDKWQQSPDQDYDEQPQTWLPLNFNDQGDPLPLEYVDRFTLDVAV